MIRNFRLIEITITNILIMFMLSISLSIPNAYTIAGALFAIIGLFYLLRRFLARAPIFEPHLSGKLCLIFMAYALICALIQLWHGASIKYYEMYIPFLWAPLIVLAVLDGHIDRRFVWLGCFLGALLACLLALFQTIQLGAPRPYGFLGSPITFGNNALLLGSVALAGRHDSPLNLRKPVWLALAYLGFGFGVVASLTTQSKGGWPLIPVVLIWVLVEDFWRASRQGRLILAMMAFIFVCLLPFMPLETSLSRIKSAANGTLAWFETGEVVEGSADARLELWSFGLSIWPEKPWLGHGREGVVQRMHEKIAQGEVHPWIKSLTGLHNEPIQLLAEQGLIGLFSWVMIFTASILVFGRAYLQRNGVLKVLGQAGLVTVAASLIFGLSDMNLMLNANRQIFVLLLMTLTALVIAERRRTQLLPKPTSL
ncbi:O-antigen ligase family protein [Hoeflea sp.]|uniref:O-antigen ligase family protein n=1 Tax=Hoeflea sp. TaxID=1940281 RepID=UPI003A957A02